MPRIYVAVASARKPKLDATRETLKVLGSALDSSAEFEVVSVDVPSGVRHTPLSRAETVAGARSRVDALTAIAIERDEPWRYLVGLEGGLNPAELDDARCVFLESWALVADRTGRSAWGYSPGILLPDVLVEQVVDHGQELAQAIDALAGRQGIRDEQGAWGVLSRQFFTRQDAFRAALIGAFAPFYNREIYGRE
jgi:inosine/xanthosine triphosphatase